MAEALSAHYWAAGDSRRAFEAGMRAWRIASSRSEWRNAVRLIERAEQAARHLETAGELGEHERVELSIAAGETFRSVGRIREAGAVIGRAVAEAQAVDDNRALPRALFIRGLTEMASSAYADARASLTQALDLFLEAEDPDAVAQTTVQLAAVWVAVGNCERAADLVESILASSTAPEVVAQAHAILGWARALRGQCSEGAALLERSLEYHDRAGNLRERAAILRRLHGLHLSRGDYEKAIALAVRARDDSDTVGDSNGVAKANMGIGQARVAQGLHAEGISFLTRAIEQLQRIGDLHCEAECLWQLGRARCEMGQSAEADALLQRALGMIREIGDRNDEFRILIDCARACMARGELDRALCHAEAAAAMARDLGSAEGAALAQLETARIDLATGDARVAREKASRAVAVLDQRLSSERWRGWCTLV